MKRLFQSKWMVGAISIVTIAMVYFGVRLVRTLTVTPEVKPLESPHFYLSYSEVYESDAKAVLEALEENFDRVRNELGDPRHDRINVHLHGTRERFAQATGLTNNANGTSRGPREFHVLWTNWLNSIFPDDPEQTAVHEFTHCVQLNILIQQYLIGYKGTAFDSDFEKMFSRDYPRWFWESVSVYEANEVNALSVRYAFRSKPSLEDLNHGNRIYFLGHTLIDFILGKWGNEKLRLLIRSYCDIEKVLGVTRADFEKQWQDFVAEKY